MKIKKYKLERVEIDSIDFELPTETEYFFETGIRRSIKVIPIFTTWQKESQNKDEEVYQIAFVCVYSNFESKIERIEISVSNLERLYYNSNEKYHDLIKSYIDGEFNKRTKEQFEGDFEKVLNEIKS